MPERKSIDPQTREALKKEIRDILVDRAKHSCPTITYKQLAAEVQTHPLHYRSKDLHDALVDLSAEENAAGRGMLSAVVIRSGRNKLPGDGFFDQAARLGRDTANRRAAWTAELRAVCACWRGQ